MSKFSELLTSHIDGKGLKVYTVAKNAHVDRSSLQRAVKGERLPNDEFIKKVFDALELSASEEKELSHHYNILKYGETAYKSRTIIKELIEKIVELNNTSIRKAKNIIELNDDMPSAVEVVTGEYQVSTFMKDILSYESQMNSTFNVFIPFEFSSFYEHMHYIYLHDGNTTKINQLLPLVDKDADPSNLETLSNILLFSLNTYNANYDPRYFFCNNYIFTNEYNFTPYYFLTENRVILISKDFKMAVHCTSPDLIKEYSKHFDEIFSNAHKLVQNITTENSRYLDFAIANSFDSFVKFKYISDTLPYMTFCMTRELIDEFLADDTEFREQNVNAITSFFEALNEFEGERVSYFTKESIQWFAEEGIFPCFPKKYYTRPVGYRERLYFLEQTRAKIVDEESRIHYFAIDTNKFKYPNNLSIQVGINHACCLILPENDVHFSNLTSPLISCFFEDFLHSLRYSEYVLKRAETLSLFDNSINWLKEQIAKEK